MRTKAIVTGHSRGLGAALADELLARGVHVLGLSRQGNPELAAAYPLQLRECSLDLGDSAALAAWLAGSALQDWLADAALVLLINNAGTLQPMALLPAQEPAAVGRAIALSVAAPLMLAAALVPASPAAHERRIVHVSSGAARKPYAGWSVYCAGKAALDHHARAVQAEAIPGLRICSLAPGVLDTAMQAEIRAASAERFPQRERFVDLQRSGALVAPEVCAMHLVDYLLDDDFGREAVADLRDLMR